MFISKHHYALELSKLGNNVYFLNGPDQRRKLKPGEIKIETTDYPNLYVVHHRFFFPYIIRFKAKSIFNNLIVIHVNRIIKKIKKDIDIVWSFDLSNAVPLKAFPEKNIKIFMPVDEPSNEFAIKAAENANVIFSVTNEILEKYKHYKVPKIFLNHGVAEIFINNHLEEKINNPLRVGLSGNFLRPDIDRLVLLKIIELNPSVIFDCWGSVSFSNSNIAAPENNESVEFSNKLCSLPNVKVHGNVNAVTLSKNLKDVDCFLICYDIQKDQSKGTNYHKILEYLATGKVIISNNVTTYQKHPGLMVMSQSRYNNDELPGLFSEVINHIEAYNAIDKQQMRIEFAREYLYPKQLKKIEQILTAQL
jgi:hypothetical protein